MYEDKESIYLLMEPWGKSLEKILQSRMTLMESEAQLIFCQMVDILEGLRALNISHGGISLSSLMLYGGVRNTVKLTSFYNSQDLWEL